MRRQGNMFKGAMVMALAGAMAVGMAMTSFAAGWQHNDTGWWYGTNEDNTMWYASGWEWIDSNGDGVAECYYFDTRGYMLAGTTTPDGYTVNADGAWVHDDTVQTKKVEPIAQSQVQGDLPRTDVYDSHGISMAALDIKSHTRQENAKYGEVKVTDNNGYDMTVYYSNGLDAHYYLPNSGSFYKEYGDYPDSVGSDKPSLVFKEDVTGKSEDVGNALKRNGYDAYVNGWVIVRMKDIDHRLEIHEVDELGRQFILFY